MAVINGVQATLAAFASGSKFGPVVGAAYAAAAGVVAAANIAKISNTRFNPTATTAPPGDDSGASDASVNIPQTETQNPASPIFQPTTGLNADGSTTTTPGALKIYEGDMTEAQGRVEVLEGKARF